jgi:membrane fusion protein (multidrug efflux system)
MLQIETELRSLEAVARVAQIRYERAAIRAPFAGIVTNRFVELGQLVVPGMLVARIVDPYVLKLEGALTEREIGFVRKGGNATVTCQGVRGTDPVATQASIHWVGFEADPLTGKFPVEIRIENPDLVLRPGVIGCARVVKMHHENVIVIPRDAVVQRATGPVAYVVAGGIAQERRLTLGPDQGLMVVVKDGLRAGDSLVVRGQRDIHDGSAVVIREATTAADGSLPTDPDVVRQTRTDRETPQSQATRGGGSR